MGILKSGLLGPFRNKTAYVIGRRRRGQNVMTGLHKKSNKAPSESQLEERLKFGLLNSFLSDISSLADKGFKRYAKVQTPLNVAYSYNVKHAFVKQGEEWQINFPKMVYSRGHVDTPDGAMVTLVSGEVDGPDSKILFSWDAQKQTASCQYTDMASFLVYNASKKNAMILRNAVDRYALSYEHQLPLRFMGDTLHSYMNFDSLDGRQTGQSVYLGLLVIS
jgi:hypothetical protein